mgnify:CR=1 FL=1
MKYRNIIYYERKVKIMKKLKLEPNKKLSINKETIRNLSDEEVLNAAGATSLPLAGFVATNIAIGAIGGFVASLLVTE